MHRHIALTVGVAASGLAAAAFLPVAAAFADTGDPGGPVAPSATGPDAFTFGNFTYDPFTTAIAPDGTETLTEGWGPATVGFGAAPWFAFGEVAPQLRKFSDAISTDAIRPGLSGAQTFEVYNADGTDLGEARGAVDTANILGIQNTQVTIGDFEAAVAKVADVGPMVTATTPTVGSVYDVTDFGSAVKNIYWAIPGANGAPTQIHDVLDLFGMKIPLPTSFDATDPFNVGAGFGGIHEGGHLAVSGPDAFTFGNFTYDPFTTTTTTAADGTVTVMNTEGWEPVTTSFGAAPWFAFGRVVPGAVRFDAISPGAVLQPGLAGAQSFEVYNSAGTDLGSFNGAVNTMNFLGIQSTEVTIAATALKAQADFAPDPTTIGTVPTAGSVYDVTDFGIGKNVYWAIPGAGPNGTTSIHDVLNLFGLKIPVLTSFDAVNPFNVGAGFAGIDEGGTASVGAAAGHYAFTFGNFTYDPFTTSTDATGDTVNTEGWAPATATFGAAPWFEFGQLGPARAVRELLSTESLALRAAGGQTFEAYDATGTDLGTAYGQVNTANILGIQNTQVTIGDFESAATDPSAVGPTVGSVYDVTQFPFGIENIYWAVPGANGATEINDVLDLFGVKIPLLVNFDATAPFDVGAGMTGDLGGAATSAAADAADPLAFFGL